MVRTAWALRRRDRAYAHWPVRRRNAHPTVLAIVSPHRHRRLMDDRTHLPAAPPATAHCLSGTVRHDWTRAEVAALFNLPFPDLIFHAQRIHRMHFDPREVQISTLLSIKTGGCPEDCAYCPQSARYPTGVKAERLMAVGAVVAEATAAKAAGASRFCMGAAWRAPKERDLDRVCAMVAAVKG